MRCPTSKQVPYQEAVIGKMYSGYTRGTTTSFCDCEYLGDRKVLVFGKYEEINVDTLTDKYSWDEQEKWYRDRFDITDLRTTNNLYGLFHDMYDVGDAYHEMWNGWIDIDWYEMSAGLQDEDFYLLGIAPAPSPWAGHSDPVAFVCATYDDTQRFWCHGGKDWVENMREQMKDIYKEIFPHD